MLRETITLELEKEKNIWDEKLLDWCVSSLISVSLGMENEDYFFTLNILSVIHNFIEKTNKLLRVNSLLLLKNICSIDSLEQRKEIGNMFISLFFQILNNFEKSSLKVESSDDFQACKWIMSCFQALSYFSDDYFFTTNIDMILNTGIFSKIVDILSFHISEIKKKELGLPVSLIWYFLGVFFNISIEGSLKEKVNTRKNIFDEKVKNLLMDIYQSISTKDNSSPSSQSLNSDEKEILNKIAIILINIHKGELCPSPLLPYLSAVNVMMSLPHPNSGIDWPRWSLLAWEGVLDGKESLFKYKNENK
jgi:hypothetical protein